MGVNKNETELATSVPKIGSFLRYQVLGDERKGSNTWRVVSFTPSAPGLRFRDLVPRAYL